MSTLSAIEFTLYDRLGFDSAPDTKVTTRLRRFINETQREILGTRGVSRLRRRVLTFTCVANTPFAVFPQAAVNVLTVQDRVNDWVLDPVSLEDLRAEDPGLTAATTYPNRFVLLNYAAPVARDPDGSSALFVVSDSASDGNTKVIQVEGVNAAGYYQTASVAMNGITPASLGTLTATWVAVTKFYIAPASGTSLLTAAGNVTITQGSGGTELGRIPPGRAFARYTRIHLHPTPSQVNTYYADVELHIEDMSSLADEPYLPEDFHWMLTCGALKKEYQRKEKPISYGIEDARWKKGISDLKLFIRRNPGVALGLNRRYRMRFSQLGPNYPVGT